MTDLTLAARLALDVQKWTQGLGRAKGGLKTFVSGAKQEFAALRSAMGSLNGQLATLGVGTGIVALTMQSARMDKSLIQVGQTAGATKDQVAALRGELFSMSSQTGQSVDDLQAGFNTLIQSGLTWDQSRQVIAATNKTMAVTGAQAETLAGVLGVAQTAFNFDLGKPKQAQELLDKMTVSGRLGNAELESLSSIVSRLGVNAAGAGFGFDKTLAFVEGLSMIERQPERLATLADSTLRLFTNARYMKASQAGTGVKFFGTDGSRRDPLVILADIKKKYDALTTDAGRQKFLSKAFGQADQDTIKGLKTLLGGDMLAKINSFSTQIGNAGGTIERDLPAAMANSVDQAGRLKTVLRQAADGFATPINKVLANGIEKLINPKDKGGYGLTSNQLAGGAVATLAGGYALSRLPGILGRFFGGVAQGKALEAAAGVTPVFVTNMPSGGIGGAAGDAATGALGARAGTGLLARLGLGGLRGLLGTSLGALAGAGTYGGAAIAGGVGAAAVGGGLLGKGISDTVLQRGGPLGSETGGMIGDKIGSGVARYLAFFGVKEAQDAVQRMDRMEAAAKLKGAITITIDNQGQARVGKMTSNNSGVVMQANTGRLLAGGGR